MINTSRCREKDEGWLGRRRTYTCPKCKARFQEDETTLLPNIDRFCPDCKKNTYIYTFINKRTGKDTQIRATDSEMATLKAWRISSNLTFKVPQPETSVESR